MDLASSNGGPVLRPGTRLGGYEILQLIGAGGMGEVYRARDIRLRRDVAIKILPATLAHDVDRLRRFEREAQVLASLNHPHIAAIYGIEESAGTTGLVLELVEGQTLVDRTASGPIAGDEALAIARQIADALDAAHERGVVHRDLKPANVKLTPHGAVKVLDFGLAKIEPDASDVANSPTITAMATQEGVIAGTAPYMSPEQARGKPVDKRADIWAFGCVLYELITGKRAFLGNTTTDVLAAVIHREPDWTLLPRTTPPNIRRLLIRCLEKDAARRLRDIGEARVEIDDALTTQPVGKMTRRRPLFVAVAIVAASAAAAVVLTDMWSQRRAVGPAPVLTRLTSDSGLTTDPAISSDGRLLAFASDRSGEGHLDIWVKQVAGGDAVRLTRDAADDHQPAFSPDSTRIVFRSERDEGGIYGISALGGAATLLAREGRAPRFSPDGRWIAYWTGVYFVGRSNPGALSGRLFVVATNGGVPIELSIPGSGSVFNPIWSPDSMNILVQGVPGANAFAEQPDWWVVPFDGQRGGTPVRTGVRDLLQQAHLSAATPSAWLAQGDHILFSARAGDTTNVWRIALAPQTWRATAAPMRLTLGTGLESQASLVAADGTGSSTRLIFSSSHENIDIWAIPIHAGQAAAAAEPRRLTNDANADVFPAISTDGRTLAFSSRRSGNSDIWVKDLQNGTETAVTSMPWDEGRPALTADASKVAYEFKREPTKQSCQVAALGPGGRDVRASATLRALPENCWRAWSWSSDGSKLLYLVITPKHHVNLFDSATGETRTLVAHESYNFYQPYFSPDDRWVSFLVGGGPLRSRVVIAPYRADAPLHEASWVLVTDGKSAADKPRWSADGKRIYYTANTDGFHCIWARDLDPLTKQPLGSPFAVYHSHTSRLSIFHVGLDPIEIGVATDKLVFPMSELTGNIWMTTVPPVE